MEYNDIILGINIVRDIHIRLIVVIIFDATTLFFIEKGNRFLGERLEKCVLFLV
jgi:hypothetical protein